MFARLQWLDENTKIKGAEALHEVHQHVQRIADQLFPKQCVHTEGFLVSVKGGFFHCGTLCGPQLFHCKFLHKIYLVRCPCAQAGTKWLSRFASRSFFVAGAVLYRLREKSGWKPQPSRHFVRVRLLSLWRGANFDVLTWRSYKIFWNAERRSLHDPVQLLLRRSCGGPDDMLS